MLKNNIELDVKTKCINVLKPESPKQSWRRKSKHPPPINDVFFMHSHK